MTIESSAALLSELQATRRPTPTSRTVVRYQLRYIPIATFCFFVCADKVDIISILTKEKRVFFIKNIFLIFILLFWRLKIFTLSLQPQNDGAIAQLVEQRTENPCVPGSIPGGTTFEEKQKKQTPDFQKKSGVFCFPARRKKVRNMTVSGVPKGGAEKVERKSPPNQILSN